jgi:hypothetical protein
MFSGLSSPVTAGTPSTFTVTATSTSGATLPNYTGSVHFTSSDPNAVLPADYTFVPGDNGTHTFSVTLTTAGSQSITASDPSNFLTGTQAGITVNPGAADHLAFSVQPSNTSAGTPIGPAVQVQVLDRYGT